MARKDPKGDVRSQASKERGGDAGMGNNPGMRSGSDPNNQGSPDAVRTAVCSALSELFVRDDGWLRIVPSGDGKGLFAKWKFTRGVWQGHYVMGVSEVYQWDVAVLQLLRKVREVDAGQRRAAKDTAYLPIFDSDIHEPR